jgi:hypothetical protein
MLCALAGLFFFHNIQSEFQKPIIPREQQQERYTTTPKGVNVQVLAAWLGHAAKSRCMCNVAGIYLASADTEGTLAIWLVDSGTVINTYKLNQTPTSLQWHPKENSLLIGGEKGGVKVLVGVVPAGKGLAPPAMSLDDFLKQKDKERAGAQVAWL